MPDDRFLHPRLGHSEKVFQLTDLEFRVWIQYQLSADDCGVMRCSAMTLQAANERLAKMGGKRLESCMARLTAIGLLSSFLHQGRTYLCQLDWQDWQKVRYPRASVNPQPDHDTLAKCSPKTIALFRLQAKEHRSAHGAITDTEREGHGDVSENDPQPTRAGACERPRLTAAAAANGNGSAARGGSGVLAGILPRDHLRHSVCGRVCLQQTQFQEFVGKLGGDRHEAEVVIQGWAARLLAEWDAPPLLTKPIQGTTFQWWDARWEEWQGRPQAAKKAALLPDVPIWECPHEVACSHQRKCQQLQDIAAEKARTA